MIRDKKSLMLPWKIIYGKNFDEQEYVDCIQNCEGKEVIKTDMGVYGPNTNEAEAIVYAVNKVYSI